MKNIVIANMKLELCTMAMVIRNIRRQAQKESGMTRHGMHVEANNLGAEFRILHTAYCLLRGRTLDQIESANTDRCIWTYKPMIAKIQKLVASKEIEIAAWRATLEPAAL
jgi:hypothetical protein